MKIKSIKIEKLFDIFDYDINLENNENLLIITGPNGFGKTMILNIIYSLFNRRFFFFQKLVFNKIEITLDNSISIKITKKGKGESKLKLFSSFSSDKEIVEKRDATNFDMDFSFYQNRNLIDKFEYQELYDKRVEGIIRNYLPIRRYNESQWIDARTERVMTIEEIVNDYSNELPEDILKEIFSIKSEKVMQFLNSIKVHLIKEQRLFRKVNNKDKDRWNNEDRPSSYMTETIQEYSQQLKNLINLNIQDFFKISQQLDSTYPTRLISEKGKLTEEDYNLRFKALNEKQEKLKRHGLYESKQAVLEYSNSDGKALLVYLNDLGRKLSVFDDLLNKLELFSSILNERRFTHKTIKIDRDKGFYFKTVTGKELSLIDLSSGEQHEVVLLYELIFNATQNTLVLIDEPEISLHITWQKEFINDLLKIIELQKIQVLIATHSPEIINDRWDLVYNLEDKER